jgi:hypothetical protein
MMCALKLFKASRRNYSGQKSSSGDIHRELSFFAMNVQGRMRSGEKSRVQGDTLTSCSHALLRASA